MIRLTVPGASFRLVTEESWVKLRIACHVAMPWPMLTATSPAHRLPPLPATSISSAQPILPPHPTPRGRRGFPASTVIRLRSPRAQSPRQGCRHGAVGRQPTRGPPPPPAPRPPVAFEERLRPPAPPSRPASPAPLT